MSVRHWSEIAPEDAVDIVLPRDDVIGPVTSEHEPCPWPWDPQQLVGVPLGQYHCPFCGEMVLAGMPHLDYRICRHCGTEVYFDLKRRVWKHSEHDHVACSLRTLGPAVAEPASGLAAREAEHRVMSVPPAEEPYCREHDIFNCPYAHAPMNEET
jgi:hypothetical protein